MLSEVKGCLCNQLRMAARAVTQLYDEALRPSGLRVTQFSLLAAVHAFAPIKQGRLARLIAMDKTTLNRNIRPLIKEGLLELGPGKALTLTAKGQRRLKKGYGPWRDVQRRLSGRLGDDAAARLLADLRTIRKEASHERD